MIPKDINIRDAQLKAMKSILGDWNGFEKILNIALEKVEKRKEVFINELINKIDVFYKEKKEKKLPSELRRHLREEIGLDYKQSQEIRKIITQTYLKKLLGTDKNEYTNTAYLDFIQYFASQETRYGNQNINLESLWNDYVELRFIRSVNYFFKRYKNTTGNHIKEDSRISINFAIWSFLLGSTLPLHRKHLNFDEQTVRGKKDLESRNRDFSRLANAQTFYSTMDEVMSNQITHGFYFNPVQDKEGYIEISEVNLNGEYGRVYNIVKIDGQHRKKMKLENRFSLKTLDAYKDARNKIHNNGEFEHEKEIKYQNQVIRWYIRAGIFDPRKAKLKNETIRNLLEEMGRIKKHEKILNEQYRKSGRSRLFTQKEDKELDELIEDIFQLDYKQIAARLWVFDKGFLDLSQFDNSISDIYWIPLFTGLEKQKTGGVLYLNVDGAIHNINDNKSLWGTLSDITRFFSGVFDDSQMQELEYIRRKDTVYAAAAAIIVRNISHNLGSHVLSYEKNSLNSLRNMVYNNVFQGLFSYSKDREVTFNKRFKKVVENNGEGFDTLFNDIEMPYLEAKGHLDGYLQGRNDYVSAVASGMTYYYSSINFIDDVLLYFMRYKKSDRDRDTFRNKLGKGIIATRRNILLERISESEEYRRRDIKISYKEKNCGSGAQISVPTGLVGRQAVLSMLENIIRNTAKHGQSKEERGGQIKINLEIDGKVEGSHGLYKMTLADNSGKISKDQFDKIKASIVSAISEDKKVNESQKGIKEIQIASAWLRGIDLRDIDEAQKSTDKTKPLMVQQTNDGIKYTVYLKKALKVLLVGTEVDTNIKKILDLSNDFEVPAGWGYCSPSELELILKDNQYKFVLLDTKIKGGIDQYKNSATVRFFPFDFSEIKKSFDGGRKIKEIENRIYEQWLIHKADGTRKILDLSIGIRDDIENETHKKINIYSDRSKLNEDIIFSIHNDTQGNFESFEKNNRHVYTKAIFIEGISGNNSTSRLIREEPLDKNWKLKIQESASSSVLIIDERLWNKSVLPSNDGKSFKADLDFEYKTHQKKNIEIYTLKLHKKNEELSITIHNLKDEFIATLTEDGTIKNHSESFDFISMHQGLLDKVYNHFRIEDEDKREAFFLKFRNGFSAKLRYYLHSGRSFTPSLPKNTGFVPLSSLDAALSDCKYALTEVLYSGTITKQ